MLTAYAVAKNKPYRGRCAANVRFLKGRLNGYFTDDLLHEIDILRSSALEKLAKFLFCKSKMPRNRHFLALCTWKVGEIPISSTKLPENLYFLPKLLQYLCPNFLRRKNNSIWTYFNKQNCRLTLYK